MIVVSTQQTDVGRQRYNLSIREIGFNETLAYLTTVLSRFY